MKIKLSIIALAAALFAGLPVASSSAYVGVSVNIAPPLIPVYSQPYCPGPGYIWTPGYWAYSDFGYYWTPGIWVRPPRIGYLWTPGYWGYRGNSYSFYDGYWGPTVGYYGGINYGFGYVGSGYYGGRWAGNTFRYNTAVNRVNRNVITNTYVDNSFSRAATATRASFNGPGGVNVKQSGQQAVPKSKRIAPTREQRSIVDAAQKNPALQAKNNKGKPDAAAVNSVRSKVNPAAAEDGQAARNGKPDRAEKQNAGAGNRAAAQTQDRPEKQSRLGKRANGADQAVGRQGNRAEERATAQKPERKTAQRPERTTAQKPERKTAQRVERSRPTAEVDRTQRTARPVTRQATQRPSVDRNKVTNRSRPAVQRTQRAPQRQQAVNRRPAQKAAGKAPAQGQQQQQGKKKKRQNPDDQ
ncbi:MAG: hypothetical protein ABIU29_07165 [Chthoniobacterales bacterium]